MLFDLNFYMNYLSWADNLVIKILDKLTDEEYLRDFGSRVGNIATKVEHLVGIYDFFILALEGNPITYFPKHNNLCL